MKNQLIFPMAIYIFAMWVLTVYLFRARVKAVKENRALMKYFKSYTGEAPPENAIVIGRHYDNNFQVPILFLITCVLHISLGIPNSATIVLAWAFVISRALHSWVHLRKNKIQQRVVFFASGWLIILLLWVQLVYYSL